MSLKLIIGPMFAGKSTRVLSLIRQYSVIGRSVLCLTSDLDKRYASGGGYIISHNKDKHPAKPLKYLMKALQMPEFGKADCVIIEEAQFFPDLKTFVLEAVEVYGKHVVVVGLDGDANRKPFGQILDLIPYADELEKLTAFCTACGNGVPALFSHKKQTTTSASQIQVGATEAYEPLCRTHYLYALFNQDKEAYILNAIHHPRGPEKELDACIGRFGLSYGPPIFTEIIQRRRAGQQKWLPPAGIDA